MDQPPLFHIYIYILKSEINEWGGRGKEGGKKGGGVGGSVILFLQKGFPISEKNTRLGRSSSERKQHNSQIRAWEVVACIYMYIYLWRMGETLKVMSDGKRKIMSCVGVCVGGGGGERGHLDSSDFDRFCWTQKKDIWFQSNRDSGRGGM